MERLQRWAYIAEIAGAVAVVMSLLYVGYELRRTTDISLVESSQRLYELTTETSGWEIELHVASAMVKARSDYNSLNAVEKQLMVTLVWQNLNIWEQAHLSYQNGLLGENAWMAWNNSFCAGPGYWGLVISDAIPPEGFLPEFFAIVSECFDLNSNSLRQPNN